eukprot:comp21175_c0_seq1/m.44970 comp21175_c0_seq1/g.44970  ORF comp21175_c0_seq1/g.44970 comp21175_c0_seq1/m.44970 type:complete len:454 (+) comp21175_c0_seq1:2-1363(+)
MKAVLFLLTSAVVIAAARKFPANEYQRRAISGWSHFKGHEAPPQDYSHGDTLSATYRSPPIRLADGEVVFTDPNTTPIKVPAGPFAIKSFRAQIVSEDGSPTPLSEVYLHHWLIFNRQGNRGVCGGYLNYIFGVGAESRNTLTEFPDGYAYFTTGDQAWGANIHVLRTTNVPDVKSCIECHCDGGGGGFQCCPDGSFCPVGNNPQPAKTYYLEYTIEWAPVTGSGLKPVDLWVLDASDCQIEYNVPQCASAPCVDIRTKTTVLPMELKVVYVAGHLHVGADNLTLTVQEPGAAAPHDICISDTIMGSGSNAGNEKGYVVGMTICSWTTPVVLPKGTQVTTTGYYVSDPYHDSVMSLAYIATESSSTLEEVIASLRVAHVDDGDDEGQDSKTGESGYIDRLPFLKTRSGIVLMIAVGCVLVASLMLAVAFRMYRRTGDAASASSGAGYTRFNNL